MLVPPPSVCWIVPRSGPVKVRRPCRDDRVRQFFGIEAYRGTVLWDWPGRRYPLWSGAVACGWVAVVTDHVASRSTAWSHHLNGAGCEKQGEEGGDGKDDKNAEVHNSVVLLERPDLVGHYAELVRMYILYHIQPVCQAI